MIIWFIGTVAFFAGCLGRLGYMWGTGELDEWEDALGIALLCLAAAMMWPVAVPAVAVFWLARGIGRALS